MWTDRKAPSVDEELGQAGDWGRLGLHGKDNCKLSGAIGWVNNYSEPTFSSDSEEIRYSCTALNFQMTHSGQYNRISLIISYMANLLES